jgi:hypothetical protein
MNPLRKCEMPGVYILKHILREPEGYVLLTVIETSELAHAALASPRHMPPITMTALDMAEAVAMLEEKFAEEFPGHVCTNACVQAFELLQTNQLHPDALSTTIH